MDRDDYRRILDAAGVGVAEIDERGVIVFANARLVAWSGCAALVGVPLRDLVHEADRHVLDEPGSADARIGERWVAIERSESIVSFTDVTERKRFERSLSDVADLFDAFMDASPVVSWMKNAAGEYVYANHALAAAYGRTRDQLVGMTASKLIGASLAAASEEADARVLATGVPSVEVVSTKALDGRVWQVVRFPFWGVNGERNIAGIGVDITAQRTAEKSLAVTQDQLRHAQKMEAVGRLAGGIAHDFNNILTVVLSYAAVLMRGRGLTDRAQADVEQIVAAAERAAGLTRQLLSFSRRRVLSPQVIDPNAVIAEARTLLCCLLGDDVSLRLACSPTVKRVFADAGGLGQVIMNLAVNARDAMPAGGTLTIATDNVVVDEYSSASLEIAPGPYVRISVSDTGIGMDARTRAQIFEPYFTTKDVERGTGLGLPTALGIVKQSGGGIAVESTTGAGATFHVYLPWTDRVATAAESARVPAARRGSETVLLVEDDPAVRQLATRVLTNHGYHVISAATPEEALAIVRDPSLTRIDLVLSDVVMPGMSGVDMWSKLRELRGGMRVLWISGYADDSVRRHGLDSADPLFLRKPFTPETLTARVRAALDA